MPMFKTILTVTPSYHRTQNKTFLLRSAEVQPNLTGRELGHWREYNKELHKKVGSFVPESEIP